MSMKTETIPTMYDAIREIHKHLRCEFAMQGIPDKIIDNIMRDLLESINKNVKWTLRSPDGKDWE